MAERIAREPVVRARPHGQPAETVRARGEAAPGRTRPAGDGVSDPVRLAAEVDRLAAELEAMRNRLAEIEASAERDSLTDVLNRRGFERELARVIAYLGRYPASAVLVYLDLDGFKPVNDRYGHAAGDAVLQAVAKALSSHVRASDRVGRLGGDEFAVLLWNLSEADASAKARALEAEIAAAAVAWDGATLCVGASAGVAAVAADDGAADVIARADAAMYARKEARRPQIAPLTR